MDFREPDVKPNDASHSGLLADGASNFHPRERSAYHLSGDSTAERGLDDTTRPHWIALIGRHVLSTRAAASPGAEGVQSLCEFTGEFGGEGGDD